MSHAFDSARNTVTELCSCPVKVFFFKRTESDILNYKNTVSALSSQKFESVLPRLLFVHIYLKYIYLFIPMCMHTYYVFFIVVLFVYCLHFLSVSANFQACASNSVGKLHSFSL